MGKLLKWLAIGLVALVAVLTVGGLMLPRTFEVQRSALMQAPPERIYPQIATPRHWPEWSVWNRRDPAMQIAYSGPEQGAGAVWSWKSKSQGDGTMTLTAAEPPHRVAYDLYFPDFDTTSTGELVLAPEAGGTRVTWTMTGDMGANPLYHWMPLVMGGAMRADFDAGLANLKALVESGP
ncbi:MAG: SRPBCC family protein [Proteobacteria bacterium]|nr:SRPBCC family protein [Pseudomonadota bacterium]